MTEQEKMLEMLRMMAGEARENRLNQQLEATRAIKEMFDSYVAVGFTRVEALELTKTMIGSIVGKIK